MSKTRSLKKIGFVYLIREMSEGNVYIPVKRRLCVYVIPACFAISNSNWTEWSTIQGIIERLISKSDEREARGRFEITSTITP